ncbi:hypothetical protein SLS60_006654 [Paraconiothyrium brasiliense]|uniref:Protein tyrosine phosphatase n=1 Tax=Paraconiothyrium brasiliense TaxID=300254 RepID=A0ABR3RC95_9PLEO
MSSSQSLQVPPSPSSSKRSRADVHQKFIDLEWEQRQRVLQGIQHHNGDSEQQPSQWARCTGDDVKDRNRYINVDPYQGNRIRLKVPDGTSDYINASPIELRSSRLDRVLKYIATQGPKFDTYSHFWRMIWHETTTPAVIVMLTQTHEGAREKCYPYYPQSSETPNLPLNAQDEYEDKFVHELQLASLEEDQEARATIRELDMVPEEGNESRKVWHLLFAGWPDFLVPEGADREALLRLISMSREKNADNATNPRIVHCSAGVGRSGTFIALDWLLQELDDGSLDEVQDNEDPIFGVVSRLREQRMMMVQSEPQLAFIYDVVREQWRERWIGQHSEEAERLGVTRRRPSGSLEEPQLKRQKSGPGGTSLYGEDEDERAQLEAELFSNTEME